MKNIVVAMTVLGFAPITWGQNCFNISGQWRGPCTSGGRTEDTALRVEQQRCDTIAFANYLWNPGLIDKQSIGGGPFDLTNTSYPMWSEDGLILTVMTTSASVSRRGSQALSGIMQVYLNSADENDNTLYFDAAYKMVSLPGINKEEKEEETTTSEKSSNEHTPMEIDSFFGPPTELGSFADGQQVIRCQFQRVNQ